MFKYLNFSDVYSRVLLCLGPMGVVILQLKKGEKEKILPVTSHPSAPGVNLPHTTGLSPSNTPGNLDFTTPASDTPAQDQRDPSAPPTSPVPPHPPLFDLPTFHPATEPTFVWGNHDSIHFCNSLKDAYRVVVHWRKNCFKVPLGNVGKSFVSTTALLPALHSNQLP